MALFLLGRVTTRINITTEAINANPTMFLLLVVGGVLRLASGGTAVEVSWGLSVRAGSTEAEGVEMEDKFS